MKAVLKSSAGDSEVVIDLLHAQDYATETGFESSVRIRGEHWDGDHTRSVEVLIEGLWLRTEDLEHLCSRLTGWVELPLADLDPARLDGEFNLCHVPGQVLSFRFGHRPEVPSRRQPVVTISSAAGALTGEFHFASDQSCLSAFRSELSLALAAARPTRS